MREELYFKAAFYTSAFSLEELEMQRMKNKNKIGFTLAEILVVLIIIGILAGTMTPLVSAKVQRAKWSEASNMAGAIRRAVRAAYVEKPTTVKKWSIQPVEGVLSILKFNPEDLTGTYFSPSNFTIDSVDGDGNAVISISAPADLSGSGLLNQNGWQYTP